MPTPPLTITINATDRTQSIPFRADQSNDFSTIRIEVTQPGIAVMAATIYDLNNSITINDNDNIIVSDPSTPANNAFNGYITRRRLVIQANYRLWFISCVDLNSWLDLKLVGTPDGSSFLQDPPGTYTAYDPAAVTGATDKASIQALFDNYASDLPVDYDTFVETLAPALPAGAIRWNTVTLRQALDDLAAYIGPAVRYWIDADWKLHWTTSFSPVPSNAVGPVLRLFPNPPTVPPAAPRALIETTPDHTTTFNYDSFSIEYDDGGWADSIYINGATGYTYDTKTQQALTGGSGWAQGVANLGRQRLLTINNSDTQAVRDNFGGAALQQASNPVIRGSCSVTCNFGGWFPGQAITITNTPAGLSAREFMLQKVVTEFISGKGDRILGLDWGDAPPGTIGLRRNAQRTPGTTARRPAVKMVVTVSNSSPGASGVVRVYAQATDQAGNAWPLVGKTTDWSVSVFDQNCNDVTSSATGWSLSATSSLTNIHGMAWTDLTVAPTSGLTYYVTALCTSI